MPISKNGVTISGFSYQVLEALVELEAAGLVDFDGNASSEYIGKISDCTIVTIEGHDFLCAQDQDDK